MIEQEWLPQALAIGVDYNLFWNLNPRKLKPFLKAEKLRQKHQNEFMWIMGNYIYDAVSVSVYNNLRDKKHRPQKFVEEPFQLFELEEWEKEAKIQREREKTIAFFNSLENKFKLEERRKQKDGK